MRTLVYTANMIDRYPFYIRCNSIGRVSIFSTVSACQDDQIHSIDFSVRDKQGWLRDISMTNWSYCGLEKLSVQKFKSCQKLCGYITHQPSNMSSSEALKDCTNMVINTITVTKVSMQRSLKTPASSQAMIIKMFENLCEMRRDVPPSAIWEINKCYWERGGSDYQVQTVLHVNIQAVSYSGWHVYL